MRIDGDIDRLENDRALWGDDVTREMQNIHIMAAGAGGAAGAAIINLARGGVARFTIADLDHYSYSNTNRQAGSYIDTIGTPKPEALREEI